MRPFDHHRPILYTPVAVLLVVATACATSNAQTPAAPSTPSTSPQHVTVQPPPPETVDEVVDARTVVLSNGVRARVLGLAAPAECWSASAWKFARDTLIGKPVRYSRASESAITLRLVNDNNIDYAALAVSRGAARAEKDDPVLTEPEQVAAKAGVGLWAPPCKGQDTTPAPPPPPSSVTTTTTTTTTPPVEKKGCAVTYRVAKEWPGGFHAEMVVRNHTDKPFAQWKLYWKFPSGQQIRETWGMTAHQYRDGVLAVSQDPNGTISAGGQVSLRFNAVTNGPNAAPSSFGLSGVACSVA